MANNRNGNPYIRSRYPRAETLTDEMNLSEVLGEDEVMTYCNRCNSYAFCTNMAPALTPDAFEWICEPCRDYMNQTN